MSIVQAEKFVIGGETYVVRRVCEITTHSNPHEWTVFFVREGDDTLYGVSYPKGEDWRTAPFYNVRKGGELLHPKTLEDALIAAVS